MSISLSYMELWFGLSYFSQIMSVELLFRLEINGAKWALTKIKQPPEFLFAKMCRFLMLEKQTYPSSSKAFSLLAKVSTSSMISKLLKSHFNSLNFLLLRPSMFQKRN